MCGIIAVSLPLGHSPLELKSALNAIRHRGPDDEGEYRSESRDCYLGHVRLSIVDLSASGHQPMADGTGRFVISYNGEIYNFRELRKELDKSHGPIRWKSSTDTEVIVEGFAREGISFLDKLNGIFALAAYDVQEQLLYVLRDPLGVKPLFRTDQDGVFFCSEIKGLLTFPFLRNTLRSRSLAVQLSFMYVPEPHTMYEEIQKVEPGVCFVYRDGELVDSTRLYSHLRSALGISTEEDAVVALREGLNAAVRRQLMADVPVSLFLSGGLDSSAIAYETVNAGAQVSDAYTIAFTSDDQKHDAQGDDRYFAELMARRLGLELRVITANRDFLPMLIDLAPFMEDGFADPAAINTYLICEGARKNGVKVMLSGQGADEYLGGYRRYMAEKVLQGMPAPLRSIISVLNMVLPEKLPGKLNAVNRRLRRLADLAGRAPRSRMLGMYTWETPESVARLFLDTSVVTGIREDFLRLFDSYSDTEVVDAMMKVDHYYDLMSLNLCYTDRMSMAVGVEARVPFLDFELVRIMNSIPAHLKVKRSNGKYVLKKAMSPYLPNEVVYREKAGFGLPIRAWMNSKSEVVMHYLDNRRLRDQGIFDPSRVEQILNEQYHGHKDHSYTLLTMLTQQIWLDSNACPAITGNVGE